jgi:hypothetical protein
MIRALLRWHEVPKTANDRALQRAGPSPDFEPLRGDALWRSIRRITGAAQRKVKHSQ